jgi:hypothetical protein
VKELELLESVGIAEILGGGHNSQRNDLRIKRMLVTIVGNVELDGCARTVAINVSLAPLSTPTTRGNPRHHQIEFPTKVTLDFSL